MLKGEENVGRLVLTVDLGVGRIAEVIEMNGKGSFYRVDFEKSDGVILFPVESTTKFRFLSTKEELES